MPLVKFLSYSFIYLLTLKIAPFKNLIFQIFATCI